MSICYSIMEEFQQSSVSAGLSPFFLYQGKDAQRVCTRITPNHTLFTILHIFPIILNIV